jgi:hypothetical protein
MSREGEECAMKERWENGGKVREEEANREERKGKRR